MASIDRRADTFYVFFHRKLIQNYNFHLNIEIYEIVKNQRMNKLVKMSLC